jgi:hypothetical protein
MTKTLTPAELAHRVRRRGLRIDEHVAVAFLEDWKARGVAEQVDGRWRLTKTGRAMFGGWADGLVTDEEQAA